MKFSIPYIETRKQRTWTFISLIFLFFFLIFTSLTIYHSVVDTDEYNTPTQSVEQNQRPGGVEVEFIHTTYPIISSLENSIHVLDQADFKNNSQLDTQVLKKEVQNISSSINTLKDKYPSVDSPRENIDFLSSFVEGLDEKQTILQSISSNHIKINTLLDLMISYSPSPIPQAPQFEISINDYLSFQNTSSEKSFEIESILSQWRQNPPVEGAFVNDIISVWLETKSFVARVAEYENSLIDFNENLSEISNFAQGVISNARSDFNQSAMPASSQVNTDNLILADYKKYLLLMFLFGFAFLVSIISLFKNLITYHSLKVKDERQKHDQDQKAILNLLMEIEPISDGDLTVNAKVTEHVTGAIADAINLTLEKLRGLVSTIHQISNNVAQNTALTHDVALRLNEATSKQTHAIDLATDKNQHISNQIKEISSSTIKASQVSHMAVSTASSGAMIVKETINGMDSIRDQMQVTSKRIKKLGESAQEIGGIIEFIKAISEQTGLLALNSAIRAASAGRQGNDFAVIADEVQHLSDRITSYVSKIEKIIQDIQQDTQKTIESMEQTTSEVVAGARLAEDAGQALEEIEKVSLELSTIIDGISSFSQKQNDLANDIVKAMEDVKLLNSETSKESKNTEITVEELLLMSNNLIDSLSGFKISENMPISKNISNN